jgi:primosomal protein N' (replication factor Y)
VRPQAVAVRREPARQLPVARVVLDVSLPHLDRPFDYLVAADDDGAAQPGVRVRVRFAGRLVSGFVVERAAASEHEGRLAMLDRVVSPEVVLTPSVARLCRAVADRYAGTLADVLRLAVPPRHARVEAETNEDSGAGVDRSATAPDTPSAAAEAPPAAGAPPAGPEDGVKSDTVWQAYPAGPSFLTAVAEGRPARAVWSALPGEDWPTRLAEAARSAWGGGRGAIVIVPDARDLQRLEAALTAVLPADAYVTLSADLGPAERYRRFLAVSRGRCRVVAGTRGAIFAPVAGLSLVAVFDDGDDLLAEPRAPYPHAREIAALRSMHDGAALLIGGFARTAEGQMLVESGWARALAAPRAVVRERAPRIEAAGDDFARGAGSAAANARLTPAAFEAARGALDNGAPVLVQVPRGGYLPGLSCAGCRRPARCRRCRGPLAVPRGARTPTCRWCGVAEPRWVCPACGGTRFRATVTGATRTAEEVGRAFPGARLLVSAVGKVRDRVDAAPLIVVATPGAEPVADGGYGAALLLDGGLMLSRPDLRAAEETVRRWMAAAALVRPSSAGGRVVIGADVALTAVQAVLRWDPATFAAAELAGRRELGFPPIVAMASLEGGEAAVGDAIAELRAPASADVLGPVPLWRPGRAGQAAGAGVDESEPLVRTLVRVPPADRKELAAALKTLAAAQSARKAGDPVRIEIDPSEL